MKKFCESLREHKLKILDFENTKMVPLTNKQQDDLYEKINICCIYKKLFVHKYTNDKNYCQVRDHCYYTGKYRGAAHSIYDLKYSIPQEIPVLLKSESNYQYNFIIKELPRV